MNLKRIELIGFKSFADKTIVDFDGGITAIVGPNGCGKSNVADAIRWVLGEQSSKLLRGTSMQDVIFNGTEKRKSLSYCEVSLVLDNTEKIIDIAYDEVILTRKLYRSGESEYLINKNTCRLADIRDILHDSGIGRDGYSIIGQGKVDEIVSSKPENRRGIFEEAAGIAKFKYKKQEAERKLERTRENLSRVNDILIEIDRQLKPLKVQAETARKYNELAEKLKSCEINNYIYKYDSAESNKKRINDKKTAIQEEMNNRQEELNKAVVDYNKNMDDVNKIDENMQSLYSQITDLTVALEKSSGESNVIRERLNLLKDQAIKYQQDLIKEQENISRIETELKAKSDKKSQNEIEIVNLDDENKNISQKYFEVVDELTKSEDEAEENQQLMISALDKLSDIKADISKLSTEKLNSMEKKAELIAKLNSAQEDLSENKAELIIATENIESLKAKVNELDKSLKDNQEKYAVCKENISQSQVNLAELYSSIASLDSRHKTLVELQKNYDGFNGAVKQLLQKSEFDTKLKNNIVGVVASLMTVPKEYESAIEMALGSQVQNIVTQNEENAQSLIEYLKQNSLGRATFLPVTSLKSRNLDDYRYIINSTKGCYGVASDLIKFDNKLSNIFENLLGATVVVDKLTTAVSMAKQSRFGFKIVTLDGDVINPQGSITGGSKKYVISSVIGRDREIEDLQVQIEKLKQQAEETELDLATNKDSLLSLEQEQNKLQENKYAEAMNLTKVQENFEMLNHTIKVLTDNISQYNEELVQVEAKIKAIDLNLNETDKVKSNIDTNKSTANESITKRQQKFENLKKERDEYNARVMEVKIKIASLKSENISLEQDIERLVQEQEESLVNVEQISSYIASNATTIETAERVLSSQEKDEKTIETNNKLNEVKAKLSHLNEYKLSLQTEIRKLDEERMMLQGNISKLQDRLFQEDLNLQKIDTELENMQARVWEDYGLTYATALEYKIEDYDLDNGSKQANILKREINNLGPVNVNAIEDSKLQEERYNELTIQNNDLVKAEQDLTKIIDELAFEMTTRFDNAFTQVNENFGKIFKELFGGGRAELVLTPSESGNPLEQGVDIIAEPPGKKLQNITLLSGGEKALTAIAILFSILKLRPMPFVLLDEIEAALDDANVGRYARYLHRFSSETQFIVITHRKPTMELADCLYGVTMQEKGVSKIVSVKLADAIQNDNNL